jgi:hypothetical protein
LKIPINGFARLNLGFLNPIWVQDDTVIMSSLVFEFFFRFPWMHNI